MGPQLSVDDKGEAVPSPAFARPSTSGVVLLGLSPKNAYYNRRNITASLRSILAELSTGWTVRPFVPEEPSVWTYLALGYSKSKALRSARRQSNEKRRQARGAAAGDVRYKDCSWEDLTGGDNSPLFRAAVERIESVYETSTAFRHDVHSSTRAVLERQGQASNEAVKIASRYLIEEVASLAIVHEVLKVDEIVFVYHKPWEVLQRFFEGTPYGLSKMSGASLVVVNAEKINKSVAPLQSAGENVQ